MRSCWPLLTSLALIGCAKDDRPERARAQVKQWAEKLDARTTDSGSFLRHQGPTEPDPWGKDLLVSYSHGGMQETLSVRSAGPDGVEFTEDDLVEVRSKMTLQGIGTGIKRNVEEVAEKGGKGLARGVVQGLREGLKQAEPPKAAGQK
jgi:hypothetical protein